MARGKLANLEERLHADALLPAEREAYARTERVVELEERGKTAQQIADALHVPLDTVKGWKRTESFKLMRKAILARKGGVRVVPTPTEQAENDRIARMALRAEWNKLGREALRFFQRAFERDDDDEYLDKGMAERAAGRVADSLGLTTPEPVTPPRQHVPVGVVQARMSAIAAADRRETVVRVTVGETTEIAVATRDVPVDL